MATAAKTPAANAAATGASAQAPDADLLGQPYAGMDPKLAKMAFDAAERRHAREERDRMRAHQLAMATHQGNTLNAIANGSAPAAGAAGNGHDAHGGADHGNGNGLSMSAIIGIIALVLILGLAAWMTLRPTSVPTQPPAATVPVAPAAPAAPAPVAPPPAAAPVAPAAPAAPAATQRPAAPAAAPQVHGNAFRPEKYKDETLERKNADGTVTATTTHQPIVPEGKKVWRCGPDGKPANPGTGWCND